MVKKHSLVAAFTALFITAPLKIKETHLKMFQREFGKKEIRKYIWQSLQKTSNQIT